jgi:4-amino-4-deoxy-L-arabinose transferase-like glycosyltransferase
VRVLPVPILLPILGLVAEQGFAGDGADYYLPLAHGLATRGEFSLRAGSPTAMYVPLFPLLAAGLETLGWRWPAGPAVACQALLGALILILLFVWARMLLGVRAAALALAVGCVLPDLAVYSYLAMSENLALVLVLLAFIVFHKALASGRLRWYALTGLLLGLAGLAREFCLTFVAPLGFWAIHDAPSARSARRVGLMVLTALLAITPWTARNYIVLGEWIPLTDKAALNIYVATLIGRHHPSDPRRNWELEDPGLRDVDQRLKASLATARTSRERNGLYLGAAWENVRRDPWGQLGYLGRKAGFFWQANVGLRHHSRIGLWPVLGFSELTYWLVIAAAIGSIFVAGGRGRTSRLLWLLVCWTFLFHLVAGEAEPRYHFLVLPALLVLAVIGLDGCWSVFRPGTRRLVTRPVTA